MKDETNQIMYIRVGLSTWWGENASKNSLIEQFIARLIEIFILIISSFRFVCSLSQN